MENCPLLVFPHKLVAGFDGEPSFSPGIRFSTYPLYEGKAAIEHQWEDDAHCALYHIPGEAKIPRLNKPALAYCRDKGEEPVVPWVFVDVDNPGHAPWPSDESDRQAALANVVQQIMQVPECRSAWFYTTRAGYRLVWRLQTPLPASLYESYLGQFLAYLAEHGIPVDAECTEWNRLYRLPRVVRDGEVTSPTVVTSTEGVLRWEAPVPLSEERVRRPGSLGLYSPDYPEVTEPYEEEIEQVKKSRFYKQIKGKRPLGTPGNRNATMLEAVAEVSNHLPVPDAVVLFRLLKPCVVADDRNDPHHGPPPTLSELWRQCVYISESRQIEKESADRMMNAVLANLKTEGKALEGETPEDIRKRLVLIATNGGYYHVLDETTGYYGPPVPKDALWLEASRRCPNLAPRIRTTQGALLGRNEMLLRHGIVIQNTVAVMNADGNTFDPTTQTLYRAICKIRSDIQPVYHREIDDWLRLLGGSNAERLLDWLAALPQLDSPTCALVLEGEPGAGKGMLVEGVARLWGSSAVDYADLLSDFNERLEYCPIIHADEGIPEPKFGKAFSSVFRTIVGSESHTLRRKFRDNSTIRGAFRLIITANNDDALRIREDLTKQDLQAIVDRIGHIHVGEEPARYLEQLGGRSATRSWVAGDGIAQHVLWLANNRQFRPGPRFLVQGWKTDFHERLQMNAGGQSSVLQALALLLHRDIGTSRMGIDVENQEVIINASALRDAWGLVAPDGQAPSIRRLAADLRSLSSQDSSVRFTSPVGERLRGWPVDLTKVCRMAEELQVVDAEELSEMLHSRQQSRVEEESEESTPPTTDDCPALGAVLRAIAALDEAQMNAFGVYDSGAGSYLVHARTLFQQWPQNIAPPPESPERMGVCLREYSDATTSERVRRDGKRRREWRVVAAKIYAH